MTKPGDLVIIHKKEDPGYVLAGFITSITPSEIEFLVYHNGDVKSFNEINLMADEMAVNLNVNEESFTEMTNLLIDTPAFSQEEIKPGYLVIVHRKEEHSTNYVHAWAGFVIEVAPLEIKLLVYNEGEGDLFHEISVSPSSMVIDIKVNEIVDGLYRLGILDPLQEGVMD